MAFDPIKNIPAENRRALLINIAELMFGAFVVGAIAGMWFAASACK